MIMDRSGIELLIKRTNLTISFTEFLKLLPIRKIIKVAPILEGYEDANFILETITNRYVLKIFASERSEQNIKDYAKVLSRLEQIKVPSLKMIGGLHLQNKVFFILSPFFDGQNFVNISPTLNDIVHVTKYLAKVNTLNFAIEESYDSWGNKNLFKEFNKNKEKLSRDQLQIVNPLVQQFKGLNFKQFSQSFIHGDMQKKHVLKSKQGKFLILDFGCMSYGPKIIDLSTYLAWFCLDENNWKDKEKIIKAVVDEYLKIHQLSPYELQSLIVLTKASWTAYYLKTSFLIKKGDSSLETKDWHDKSKTMLELSKNW